MLDDLLVPSALAVRDMMARVGGRDFADMTPLEARRAFANGVALFGGETQTIAETCKFTLPCRSGGRHARLYRPATNEKVPPGMLWLHGGGFVFGDLDSYDKLCRAIASVWRTSILSFEYRLAPEAPFPAAFEDCADAWRWFELHARDLGVDRRRLSIGGDSAGATLAIASSLECPWERRPEAMVLAYPGTSTSRRFASHDDFGAGYILTNRTIDWCLSLVAPEGAARRDPRLVPLEADLTLAPPTVLLLAGCDPLRDEGLAFAKRLVDFGVPNVVREYAGMPHGFLSFGGSIPGCDQVLAEAAAAWRGLQIEGPSAIIDGGGAVDPEAGK